MRRAIFTSAFAATAIVAAQEKGETGPNNSTTPTITENEINIHIVTVGLIPDAFSPNSIIANPGDKVMFQFYPGNHSVIESLYGWPCIPKSAINGQSTFFSQFFPDTNTTNPQTWNLTVTHTDPIFYYCGAPGSCINYGMLGVINPTNETNLTAQIDLAKQSRFALEPNQTLPSDAAASISSLASTLMSTNSSSPNPDDHHHHSLSGGAIAGIVIGAVAVLAIIGALVYCLGRRKGQIKSLKNTLAQNPNSGGAMTPAQPPPKPHGPPEMQVDGVTYVPAHDPRASKQASSQHTSWLPPYHQYADHRSKSPDSVSYGGPPSVSMGSPFSSPPILPVNRYSEMIEQSYFTPALAPIPAHAPLHELQGDEHVVQERAEVDADSPGARAKSPPVEI